MHSPLGPYAIIRETHVVGACGRQTSRKGMQLASPGVRTIQSLPIFTRSEDAQCWGLLKVGRGSAVRNSSHWSRCYGQALHAPAGGGLPRLHPSAELGGLEAVAWLRLTCLHSCGVIICCQFPCFSEPTLSDSRHID